MDGIVVADSHRGQGIGTALLQRIVDYGKAQQFNRVRLDVIDTNTSARKLYQRFGFKVTKEESYPYLSILGFVVLRLYGTALTVIVNKKILLSVFL